MPVLQVRTRLALPADAEAIRAIYNAEVVGSTVTFDMVPRTSEDQLAWLVEHSGAHPAIVAVDRRPDRSSASDRFRPTAHGRRTARPWRIPSTSTAIIGARSVGSLLLTELVAPAGAHGFHAMMARIVGGHEVSIALHRACGFELVGIEREVGRKFSHWLDVALMQRLL